MSDERIRADAVATRLGVSERTVLRLAKARALPAIQVGASWTFDPHKIQAWIDAREGACHTTSTSAVMYGGLGSPLPEKSIDEAYERAIGGSRKATSKRGKLNSRRLPSSVSAG